MRMTGANILGIHYRPHEGFKSAVILLLDKGADVHAQSGYDGHAIQRPSYNGNESVVMLLLENGVDVSAKGGCYAVARCIFPYPNLTTHTSRAFPDSTKLELAYII